MTNFRSVVTLAESAVGVALLLSIAPAPVAAQRDVSSELSMERPIPALNTIWIEEMTWILSLIHI